METFAVERGHRPTAICKVRKDMRRVPKQIEGKD